MSCQTRIITITRIIIANLALTGTIFTSGFYSKELIIEIIRSSNINATCILRFIICMCITSFYSIKLITFTCATNSKQPIKITKETNDQSTRKIILVTPSVIIGNKINWLININTQIPYIRKIEKIRPVIVFIIILICLDQIYKYQNNKKINKRKIIINYI
jgi:NADH:ubiquinone oxidoreductase subunit 5 (subunit L)/multisubunit Na+/H+ antiporter MnhA subunit